MSRQQIKIIESKIVPTTPGFECYSYANFYILIVYEEGGIEYIVQGYADTLKEAEKFLKKTTKKIKSGQGPKPEKLVDF